MDKILQLFLDAGCSQTVAEWSVFAFWVISLLTIFFILKGLISGGHRRG